MAQISTTSPRENEIEVFAFFLMPFVLSKQISDRKLEHSCFCDNSSGFDTYSDSHCPNFILDKIKTVTFAKHVWAKKIQGLMGTTSQLWQSDLFVIWYLMMSLIINWVKLIHRALLSCNVWCWWMVSFSPCLYDIYFL